MFDEPKTTSLPGAPDLDVCLRRSARARRYSLRISQLDGRVTLTLPQRAPLSEGLAFLREKEAWIREHLARRPEPQLVGPGTLLPFEGRQLQVTPAPVRSARIEGQALLVPQRAPVAQRVQAFLKLMARERLASASDKYAAQLGRPYGKLSLRDTRSRWGSCSSTGNLSYSWRLIMAPAPVLDYVAAHEVAHLQEMNHAPVFWQLVAQLCPDYAQHRAWLHEFGADLHQLRFQD